MWKEHKMEKGLLSSKTSYIFNPYYICKKYSHMDFPFSGRAIDNGSTGQKLVVERGRESFLRLSCDIIRGSLETCKFPQRDNYLLYLIIWFLFIFNYHSIIELEKKKKSHTRFKLRTRFIRKFRVLSQLSRFLVSNIDQKNLSLWWDLNSHTLFFTFNPRYW